MYIYLHNLIREKNDDNIVKLENKQFHFHLNDLFSWFLIIHFLKSRCTFDNLFLQFSTQKLDFFLYRMQLFG